MLVVLPYFSGDKDQAIRLALWIRDLGGVKSHDCLLIIDTGTDQSGVIEPLHEAFNSVSSVPCPPVGSQGTWGNGTTDASAANEMFLMGANTVFHRQKKPFFWLEPDAVPTRPTWLDELESEYLACGKKFMGAFVNIPPHEPHMSGVSCYPFDVANHSISMMMPDKMAWDYAGRDDTVRRGKAAFTKLIQHEYRIHGESPRFPTIESLAVIRPETAVFHRCKDGSLIDRLRETMHLPVASSPAGSRSSEECASPIAPSLGDGASLNKDDHEEPSLTLAEQISSMVKSLARIAASKPERSQMVQDALVSEKLILQKGGDAKCATPYPKALSESKRKQGKPMKKRKMSPERLTQLRANMEKARAAKLAKA